MQNFKGVSGRASDEYKHLRKKYLLEVIDTLSHTIYLLTVEARANHRLIHAFTTFLDKDDVLPRATEGSESD